MDANTSNSHFLFFFSKVTSKFPFCLNLKNSNYYCPLKWCLELILSIFLRNLQSFLFNYKEKFSHSMIPPTPCFSSVKSSSFNSGVLFATIPYNCGKLPFFLTFIIRIFKFRTSLSNLTLC